MDNFRDAKFSGIDSKILTFPMHSYPVGDMKYDFSEEMKSRIYIRESYKEMYDIIMTMHQMKDAVKRRNKFLITGTPGIGKSLFALYFIKRYLDENNYCAPFAFQRNKEKADIITSNGDVYKGVPYDIYRSEKNLPFFCDAIDKFEPDGPSVPKLMIVTSSPDDSRFKEYAKSNSVVKLTMPVWSIEELSEMYDLFELERMHERVIDIKFQNIVKKQSLYDVYGGVPRSIQSQDGEKMIDALKKKGSIVANNFFVGNETLGTGPDIENSYTLAHLVPPTDEDGICNYFRKEAVIASRFAIDAIIKTYNIEIFTMWKNYLKASGTGGIDAATQGRIFEWIFFEKLPAKLILYPLNEKGSSTEKIISEVTETVEIPTLKNLFDTTKDVKNWTSNVLNIPISSTLESGDAFFIQGTKSSSKLYILQLTVGKKHASIKAKGLLNIVKFFYDSGYKIDSESMKMHLVFVTPKKENVLPREQMTNYQSINPNENTKNVKSIVISNDDDDRIIEQFKSQAQWLSYYT
jgi:hypothetical protein